MILFRLNFEMNNAHCPLWNNAFYVHARVPAKPIKSHFICRCNMNWYWCLHFAKSVRSVVAVSWLVLVRRAVENPKFRCNHIHYSALVQLYNNYRCCAALFWVLFMKKKVRRSHSADEIKKKEWKFNRIGPSSGHVKTIYIQMFGWCFYVFIYAWKYILVTHCTYI